MRPLMDDEGRLFEHLAAAASTPVAFASLRAQSLDDGGMDSFRLSSATEVARFGSAAAEVAFEDEDSVAMLATLYLDQDKAPFDDDVWKVDFSTLRRWPGPPVLARSRAS